MRLELPPDAPEGWWDVRGRIKSPALGGVITIYKRRGRYVARLSDQRPSPLALERGYVWRLWMKAAGAAWRYLPAEIKQQLEDAARPYHVRGMDLFLANLIGSLFAITTEDGRTIYPWRARYYVGRALDLIAATPGALLVRGPVRWEGLLPQTDVTRVLAILEGDPIPKWIPAGTIAGGGASREWAIEWETPVPAQGWQWFNQASRTLEWTPRGATITDPAGSGDNLGGIELALPAPPWRIEAILIGDLWRPAQYPYYGIMLRNSSSGRLEGIGVTVHQATVDVWRFNSHTSFNSLVYRYVMGEVIYRGIAFIVENQGGQLSYSYSLTGARYAQVAVTNKADFVGEPDRVLFGVNAFVSFPLAVTLAHFRLESMA